METRKNASHEKCLSAHAFLCSRHNNSKIHAPLALPMRGVRNAGYGMSGRPTASSPTASNPVALLRTL